MTAIKKTISIDEQVAKEASSIGPNFSSVVETALVEYIQHHRIKNAIQSFGKWETRKESSVDIVRDMRRQDDREYISRNDFHTPKK